MKKGLLAFFAVFAFGAQATQIDLSNGDVVEILANRQTTVTCTAIGGGGNISCTEGCQKWYPINTYVNGQWQNVQNCAFKTTCETLDNSCLRKTECDQFQTTNTYVNSQWQDVVSCAGTQSTLSCR